ncbi:MAG: acetyl-CoA carboxylase biotin carboxylase subunit [Pseudomonadota bacterium]
MKKVLIANRGEIAIRIIRACRELGIKSVAIHSTADRDSLHCKLADESVCIGPAESSKSYLSIPAIMSAAEVAGVDAIHPGYGFLSESAEFASVCRQYGITFIGPTPEQIKVLGNKVEARALARKAGVPLLPGSNGAITEEAQAIEAAKEIGFPLIIKAAAGGGGRGMKVVHSEADLPKQLSLARSEALSGFGDDTVYMERFLTNPRHIEIQLMGDQHGNLVYLGERDCTTQRRKQKLIEESPSPVLKEAERQKVGERALELARLVNYQSLGTAEFLYENGNFYFMEVNTRIQVEHPVTEEVMGIDLVKEQIKIAQGERLSLTQSQIKSNGHAMEVRINAEDPVSFAPWPGKITGYHEPGGIGVRVDSMIYAGYTVPPNYDSMLAKLIVKGRDRDECIQRMKRSLREFKVEGIRTNIPFYLELFQDERFLRSEITINWLEDVYLKGRKKS